MIEVGSLSSADIARVVEIHLKAMPYTLNARLGGAHLSYLYRSMATLPGCLTAVARSEGVVVGAVTAALDPNQVSGSLKRGLSAKHVLGVMGAFAREPWLIRDFWESNRLGRAVLHRGQWVRPCLTAILVTPSARQRGVGRVLVSEVDAFVRGNGLHAYHLDTRLDNVAARHFYARLGFIEVDTVGRNMVLVRDLDADAL